MIRAHYPPAILLTVWLATGCEGFGIADPSVEACEHLTSLPTPLASAASPSSAPAVATHTRYDVTLPDAGGGRVGTVKFISILRGLLLVFLSADVPIRVAAGDVNVPTVRSGKSGPCPEIKAWYEYEVGVGQQLITVGGSGNTVTTVGLVLETEADAL